MEDLRKRVGRRTRAAREAASLTQADLAHEVGVATEVYARIERGLSLPTLPTLLKLAKCLHLTPNDLLLDARGEQQPRPVQRPDLQRAMRMLERADDTTLGGVVVVLKTMLALQRRGTRRPPTP